MSKSIKKLLCENAEKWFKQNCKYDRTAKQYEQQNGIKKEQAKACSYIKNKSGVRSSTERTPEVVRETGLDGTLRFAVNGNDYVRASREGVV